MDESDPRDARCGEQWDDSLGEWSPSLADLDPDVACHDKHVGTERLGVELYVSGGSL